MRVKTRIIFEMEYDLHLEFYATKDEEEILALERGYIQEDPTSFIEISNMKGKGEFCTSVEKIS